MLSGHTRITTIDGFTIKLVLYSDMQHYLCQYVGVSYSEHIPQKRFQDF